MITVAAPASLSNLGPGFDALGLALEALQDRIEAWKTDSQGVQLVAGDRAASLPMDPARNTAAVAAQAVLRMADADFGLTLRIHKGYTPGSGLGSSAASAVAGAWAANELCGKPFSKGELVEAVLTGEAVASGARHGDNVLPALLGGLVLVSSSDPTRYRQIELPAALSLAVIQPRVEVLTKTARAILPKQVPLRDAVHNASSLAFMLDAFRAGDWETVGACIMEDRLVEPVRATLVPCYAAVRNAALDAGAFGCALSGSGPALFAIASDESHAAVLRDAMYEAAACAGIGAEATVTHADTQGARLC